MIMLPLSGTASGLKKYNETNKVRTKYLTQMTCTTTLVVKMSAIEVIENPYIFRIFFHGEKIGMILSVR